MAGTIGSRATQQPRVMQRGASNVHFPAVASALSIPPVSEATFQIVEQHWITIERSVPKRCRPVLERLARQLRRRRRTP